MNEQRSLDRALSPLVNFMERYYPDLFLFNFLMTFITFTCAWWTLSLTGIRLRNGRQFFHSLGWCTMDGAGPDYRKK